ncbi:MAG: Y-family DNA polymerase [Marinilabiliaceae bacterium]|nr:Y-family DNA polymerase [Marinilabiliaceae bacterium]
MFGLCDCNNFYVSAERVFRPDLINQPVLVLSNNDGCVISRSNEVKKLGIKMGEPFFKVKELVKKFNITVFSSNYELYADMSSRVMSILSGFSPETEIYSIDECFLDLSGMELFDLKEYGKKIVDTVERNSGIPVCLGIAPTKTLAKLSNRFAKKYPAYKRVCLMDTDTKIEKGLKLTEIGDVWGIGRRYAAKLIKNKIETAYDFTQLPKEWVRKNMSVVGERLWRELQGESCLSIDSVQPPKKQICTSRSFGQPVTDLSPLFAAVAEYATHCAYKLRQQKSYAASIMVFISTNWFNKKLAQYHNSKIITLPVPTSSTIEIINFSRIALEMIYRPGYQYKKAGVIITEITDIEGIQGNIFYQIDITKHGKLMKTIDHINDSFGADTIKVAAVGQGVHEMQRNKLSPRYTTRIQDILKVKLE